MGQAIIKLDGKYLIWSSIVDAPISFGMTLEELHEWIKEEYGNRGLDELPRRLVRVEENGTSAYGDTDVEDTIWSNRAGPGEMPLDRYEIVEWYCRRQKEPSLDEVMAGREGLPKCDPCPQVPDKDGFASKCSCFGTGVRRS